MKLLGMIASEVRRLIAARQLIEARNEAETVVQATEKSLRAPEFEKIVKPDLTPGELEGITEALAGLKQVLNSSDREAIQEKTRVLNDRTRNLAEVMMNRSVQAALAGRNISDV